MREPIEYGGACAGMHISSVVTKMLEIAKQQHRPVRTLFNDKEVLVTEDDDEGAVVARYDAECERRCASYLASPEYARAERERVEKEAKRRVALAEALKDAPENPTWAKPDEWQKAVDANQDGYGGAVISYAHRWARLMEGYLSRGGEIACCAQTYSHLANTEGITGFMYGAAVSVLAQAWIHGEALRRRHNLDTQIKDEGEKANESGGVLNPALLSIGAQ